MLLTRTLKDLVGLEYRVKKSVEWGASQPEDRDIRRLVKLEDRPWWYELPCKRGGKVAGNRAHVYQHGPTALGFTGRGTNLRRELLKLAGVRPWQAGEDEFAVVFPETAWPAVANAVKPLRKSVLPKDYQKTPVNEGPEAPEMSIAVSHG